MWQCGDSAEFIIFVFNVSFLPKLIRYQSDTGHLLSCLCLVKSTQDALKCYCLYDYGNCILTTYFILTGVIKRNALTTETTKKEYELRLGAGVVQQRPREGGRARQPSSQPSRREQRMTTITRIVVVICECFLL